MSLQAVIFDFDFALVDSSRGFIECHDYVCRCLSLPAVSDKDSMAIMGTPLAEAFRILFPASAQPSPTSTSASAADAIYAGDTVIDAQAAANAGAPFVAVLSGVTPREAFDALPKLDIVDSVAALPALCHRLF